MDPDRGTTGSRSRETEQIPQENDRDGRRPGEGERRRGSRWGSRRRDLGPHPPRGPALAGRGDRPAGPRTLSADALAPATQHQGTLRDVVREVKDARERIPELESTIDQLRAENDRLEERLSRCSCTSHDGGPDRDAHHGHQPGPTSPVDPDPDAGAAGGLTLA